ncbi:hypothetical protein GQ457_08G033220 [Hibiscus cannabinus]
MLSILSILSTLLFVFALVLRTVSLPIDEFCLLSRSRIWWDLIPLQIGIGLWLFSDHPVAVAAVFCAASDPSMARVYPVSWLTLMVNLFGRHFQTVQGLGLGSPWLTGLSTVILVLCFLPWTSEPNRYLCPWLAGLHKAAARDSHLPRKRFDFLPDLAERLSVTLLDSGTRTSFGSGTSPESDGYPPASMNRLTQLCDGSWIGLHRALSILGQRYRLLRTHVWASLLGWCPMHLGDLHPWPITFRCLDQLFLAFSNFLDYPSLRDPLDLLDQFNNRVSLWIAPPGLPDPFTTRALFNSPLDVHGLYFWRHLTAWSTQLSPSSSLMDSELIYSMENLQFTAAEAESIVVEPPCEAGDSGLWLVGSVISTKAVDGDSPVEKAAREMILKRQPWTIHDDLFSIEPYKPEWRTFDFSFTCMVILVRVFQLPLRAMNGAMGLQLGGIIGTAIRVDHRVDGGNLGEFLRILVSINITKPLRHCIMLGNGQGQKPSPCPLKYERLPRFCYFCGLRGHELASCSTKPADLDIRKLQYGSWLRVSVQKPMVGPRRKQGIEYFATNGEAAEYAGAPAGMSPPLSACSGPSAGSNSTGNDVGIPKTSGAVVGESSGTGPGLSNIGLNISATASKGSSSDQVSAAADAVEGEEGVPAAAKITEEEAPAIAKDNDKVAAGVEAAHGSIEAVPKEDGVLQPAASTGMGSATIPTEANQTISTEIGTVATLQHGITKGREDGMVRTSKLSLQGKYEVCTPIQANRSRVVSVSGSDIKTTGMSSIISPTEVVENCRGLENSSTVLFLGDFVARHTPTLVFLCETRLRNSSNSRIKASLGMDSCFTVDFGNGCNGLMLLWNNEINVSLLSYSATHIDAIVDSPTGSFHFTGFHGYHTESMKHLNWSLFDRLRQASSLPWLIGGDFNELLCHSEKEGGRRKPRGLIENFRECLHRNDLFDCKPSSGWFTFTYSNGSHGTIWERLDRFVASPDWISRHPFFRATSSFTAKLDHCILLMDSDPIVDNGPSRRGGDYFRYDNCWATESACVDKVHTVWSFTAGSAIDKLSTVGGALRTWQHNRRKSTTKRIGELQRFLDSCMHGQMSESEQSAFLSAKAEHKALLDKDEQYWAQRSRVSWLRFGDRNSAYFHARASGRKKKNRIRGLFDEADVWTDTPDEAADVAGIDPGKAPGIDRLPGSFFRQHWDLIGPDILRLCHGLLSRQIDMSLVNKTVITLIPKVKDPVRMTQLRPISLCMVVYKIVSNVLVNRMKPFLSSCIDDTQAVFLKGRLISDNILIAYELIHYLNSSKNGPNKGAAIKLDMAKAFDRVEWPFLRDIMLRMGFCSSWIDLIMTRVTTVTFSIRFNGRLTREFVPRRGLRQGDPLSPFLFLICMQGLSTSLHAEQQAGRIRGIRASQQGPRINHLLYADDSIIFIRNSPQEASRLMEVLRMFADSSGQCINFHKSAIYFSPATTTAHRRRISDILGIYETTDPVIYLGVPLRVDKNKTNTFGFLTERVDDRIEGWTKHLLSFGGREIFLKSVAQSLPQYIMSCYLLPRTIIDHIVRSMRRYWWSGNNKDRGWPLIAWDCICSPKAAGGLGFWDLRSFNVALLGKIILRLIHEPSTLLARVYRAKYFPTGHLFDAKLRDHASFAWKGIHAAIQELRPGFFWTLGRNSRVRMFADNWGGSQAVQFQGVYQDRLDSPMLCSDFMLPDFSAWDPNRVSTVLDPVDVRTVLSVPISADRTDRLLWAGHDSGIYSAPPVWKVIAKLDVLPKVRIFAWRLGRDGLPTGSRIRTAGLGPGLCPFCHNSVETPLHAFRDCGDATEALSLANFAHALVRSLTMETLPWFEEDASLLSRSALGRFITVLWNRRNNWVHNQQLQPIWATIMTASILHQDFLDAASTSSSTPALQPVSRSPPPAGTITLNVYGSFQSDGGAGISVVARDSSGQVLYGLARHLDNLSEAEFAEHAALLTGLHLVLDRGWTRVHIEMDSAQTVNRLCRPSSCDLSIFGPSLEPMCAILSAHPYIRLCYIPRSANLVAHTLASWALSCTCSFSFDSVCPEIIANIVNSEL